MKDFTLSLTDADMQRYEEAASILGQSAPCFVISALNDRASDIIATQRVRLLSERDSVALQSIVESGYKPNEQLLKAQETFFKERSAPRWNVAPFTKADFFGMRLAPEGLRRENLRTNLAASSWAYPHVACFIVRGKKSKRIVDHFSLWKDIMCWSSPDGESRTFCRWVADFDGMGQRDRLNLKEYMLMDILTRCSAIKTNREDIPVLCIHGLGAKRTAFLASYGFKPLIDRCHDKFLVIDGFPPNGTREGDSAFSSLISTDGSRS